jgi:hypothetical protein
MKKLKEVIKIMIDPFDDRSDIVSILGRNGYKTWVESKEKEYPISSHHFFVCFELKPVVSKENL